METTNPKLSTPQAAYPSAVGSLYLPLCIRPMMLEDIDQVYRIDQLSFSLPWPVNSYRFELAENPASLSWIGEVEHADGKKEIVGMVVVWLIQDEVHIATIAIHPTFRGLGYGQKLLAVALHESVQRGAQLAMLEVRAGNLAAQALYLRFGFNIVGRRLRYYQDNHEDAIIMTAGDLRNNNYLSHFHHHLEVNCDC